MRWSDISAVIFMVALSEYDMKCFEDGITNRMIESLRLFKNIMSMSLINRKYLIIIFCKYDLFKEKIKRIPITVAFNDFPENKNSFDVEDTLEFIEGKFNDIIKESEYKPFMPVKIVKINCLNTQNVSKVFDHIKRDLLDLNSGCDCIK